MYKNLSPYALGVFGRHGEMLEIALTHRFKGLEIDITEVIKRAEATTVAQACKYLASARIHIGGFELPIRWAADDKTFKEDLAANSLLLEITRTLQADRCYTTIRPTCDQRPFHENFQFHVDRLGQVGDWLADAGMKLAVNFLSAPADRADGGFEFIHQTDGILQLVSSIQQGNVGLMLDAWHWFVGGGDLERIRSLRGDQIVSVRLADIPAGADLATIKEEQRLMPGEGGTIDSVAILTTLEELGYDGPVAVAPYPGTFKGQRREATIGKASIVLDTLWTAAGLASAGQDSSTALAESN